MIWVLPGFLGQSKDFELLDDFKYQVVPLFEKHQTLNLKFSKKKWVDDFVSYIKKKNQSENILLGYSFGARLALEVLKSNKYLFSHCVLISANALSLSDREREKRSLNDRLWAQDFLEKNWQQTLQQWNAQTVLKDSIQLSRCKDDYDLKAIELAFKEYSLAQQHHQVEDFKVLQTKLLWLFGEQDLKFVKISKKMQKLGWPGQFLTIENAGHRLHLDNPQAFLKTLSEFLANKI